MKMPDRIWYEINGNGGDRVSDHKSSLYCKGQAEYVRADIVATDIKELLEEVERLRKALSAKDGNIESEGESK